MPTRSATSSSWSCQGGQIRVAKRLESRKAASGEKPGNEEIALSGDYVSLLRPHILTVSNNTTHSRNMQ